MYGLTDLETWLSAALALVVIGGGLALSQMTTAHQARRDAKRRSRSAARARARRERGISVRPVK